MLSKIRILFILPLILLVAGTAYAQNPRPQHSEQFWRVTFWNNTSLSGQPVLTAAHESIDWDWGHGSPNTSIQDDQFSGRWSRYIEEYPGTYRFTVTSDDGVRLYIDNQLVISEWREQPASTFVADVPLTAGHHHVVVEYYESGGLARLKLNWRLLPMPPNPMTVVVDDEGAGFVKAGDDRFWRSASDGYGGQMTWTRNNDHIRPKYNWARWYPELDAARYEVFVHIPAHNATTRQARYWVSHYDGYSLRVVNQVATSGWLSLGTYRFRGDGRDYVSLADVTFEPYLSQQIGFDAVKWVRR